MNLGPISTNDLQEQVDSTTGGSPYRTPVVMPPREPTPEEELQERLQELDLSNWQIRLSMFHLSAVLSASSGEIDELKKKLDSSKARQGMLVYLVALFASMFFISLFCHLINHHEHLFR